MITIATKIDSLPEVVKVLLIFFSLLSLVSSYLLVYWMGKVSAANFLLTRFEEIKGQKNV